MPADLGPIQIHAQCSVTARDRRATLACGATLVATEDVAVVAVEQGPTSWGRTLEYVLSAGQSATLPEPSPGMVWVVAWATITETDRRLAMWVAGALAVGALAGIGLAELLRRLWWWARYG